MRLQKQRHATLSVPSRTWHRDDTARRVPLASECSYIMRHMRQGVKAWEGARESRTCLLSNAGLLRVDDVHDHTALEHLCHSGLRTRAYTVMARCGSIAQQALSNVRCWLVSPYASSSARRLRQTHAGLARPRPCELGEGCAHLDGEGANL